MPLRASKEVSGDEDQVLMNETPPFRGISSAVRFSTH
jgi:hypothetical protein